MHELFCRILLNQHWLIKLRKLSVRNLSCTIGNVDLVKLYELFHGNFRRIGWIECLQRLHCRVLLRHDGFISCDWKLRCWIIFSFVGDCLLFLLGWNLHFNGVSIELHEFVYFDCLLF